MLMYAFFATNSFNLCSNMQGNIFFLFKVQTFCNPFYIDSKTLPFSCILNPKEQAFLLKTSTCKCSVIYESRLTFSIEYVAILFFFRYICAAVSAPLTCIVMAERRAPFCRYILFVYAERYSTAPTLDGSLALQSTLNTEELLHIRLHFMN